MEYAFRTRRDNLFHSLLETASYIGLDFPKRTEGNRDAKTIYKTKLDVMDKNRCPSTEDNGAQRYAS